MSNQDKLRGLFLKFEKLGKELNDKAYVTVGIQQGTGKHKDSETTVATIAAANEFGTKTIPERSFMRSTLSEKASKYKAFVKNGLKQVVTGKLKHEAMLGLLGQTVQADIQQKITDIKSPPNRPSTIARKKSDNPLIDTGQLRQSIRYKIERGE